jgi:glyoxylase-like metal-dependent hydrolase (beta-lactamase superfamily II)
MTRLAAAFLACLAIAAVQPARSQPAQPPMFATTKVDGTDGVYIFRYQGHQSMFIVTPQGVIATDPIGERRPQAVTTYIAEIRKITQAPIKYVIYSHSHYDHIAGGKPFKDLGAVFVAHKNAKAVLLQRRNPDVVVPDEVVDAKKEIELGGTTLELLYVGKNHSDNSLVMRLPKEKIVFVVDFIPLQGVQFRVMYDNYIPDLETSMEKILAMDWERIIPGHPGPGGRQIGTR